MTCPYADDDAAYVLGALDPADRAAYAAHLTGCAACQAAVAGLAAMPGLLARAHATEPTPGLGAEPPPELLPALLAQVRRERRTTRLRSGLIGLAVAAAAAGVVAVLSDGATPAAEPQPAAGGASVVQLVADPGVSSNATVTVELTAKAWGTEVDTRCSYVGPASPSRGTTGVDQPVRYTLVAIDAAGTESAVSSWNAVVDRIIAIPGATQLPLAAIDRLELRTDSGMTVLHSD